jgi:hypothetical protein
MSDLSIQKTCEGIQEAASWRFKRNVKEEICRFMSTVVGSVVK